MKQVIWIILIWAGFITACDPCDDCGEPLIYDPYIKVVFYNQDSAVALEADLAVINDSIAVIDSLYDYGSDSLDILSDSLEVIDDLISNGDDTYKDVQSLFNNYIDSIAIVLQELDTLDKYIKIDRTGLNEILSDIEDGLVKPELITLKENGSTLTYEDSAAFFNLPILLNDDNQTTYEIIIAGETYELSIQYVKYETIDETRKVYIEIAETDTVYHTFDSLNYTCKTSECISDEATIAAYF
jgi:hypothetical protein